MLKEENSMGMIQLKKTVFSNSVFQCLQKELIEMVELHVSDPQNTFISSRVVDTILSNDEIHNIGISLLGGGYRVRDIKLISGSSSADLEIFEDRAASYMFVKTDTHINKLFPMSVSLCLKITVGEKEAAGHSNAVLNSYKVPIDKDNTITLSHTEPNSITTWTSPVNIDSDLFENSISIGILLAPKFVINPYGLIDCIPLERLNRMSHRTLKHLGLYDEYPKKHEPSELRG